jgi:ribonucleoside-triphosphate reductase
LKEFGEVKGVTDKGFYVNSYHVNTETKMTPFEKIDIESQLQPYAKGGHVAFAEMINAKDNVKAYESILRYAHDKKMMYFAINSAWDFCKSCHWTGEVETQEDIEYNYKCPECGESSPDNLIITRRLCGYITSFNKRPPVAGRIKEIKSRIKHG